MRRTLKILYVYFFFYPLKFKLLRHHLTQLEPGSVIRGPLFYVIKMIAL